MIFQKIDIHFLTSFSSKVSSQPSQSIFSYSFTSLDNSCVHFFENLAFSFKLSLLIKLDFYFTFEEEFFFEDKYFVKVSHKDSSFFIEHIISCKLSPFFFSKTFKVCRALSWSFFDIFSFLNSIYENFVCFLIVKILLPFLLQFLTEQILQQIT